MALSAGLYPTWMLPKEGPGRVYSTLVQESPGAADVGDLSILVSRIRIRESRQYQLACRLVSTPVHSFPFSNDARASLRAGMAVSKTSLERVVPRSLLTLGP